MNTLVAMEGGEISQVSDPPITTVETIITNDELESDAVGEVIEAETYTDDFEVSFFTLLKAWKPKQKIITVVLYLD